MAYEQFYFHRETGNYGIRDEMTEDTQWTCIIPVGHWTKNMWKVIDDSSVKDRYPLVNHFSMGIHYPSWKCETCGLSKEQLPEGTYYREITESLHEALEAIHDAND
ncbi:hypothetical protein UFOVP223_44 [uncultured Caudovirales phage]|uniref:Uncharacterized protein n=1 Tax=uncultured Caudovirales phage TaxID=2100421 RepID=A0A6J5L349_9CAUD|nr:hypothetical protein UFOVP110_120 [uncultured Caudovirales phage]CAB5219236.1 hypothetical protein UFOVP223_44 [uncultured Caudovirales phage]